MQDVGRDDAGVQRRAEGVEAGEREFAIDDRLMREGAARAPVFFWDRRAKQTGFARLGPYLTLVDSLFLPGVDVRRELVRHEAAGLFFQKYQILAHPGRAGEIEDLGGGHAESVPGGPRDRQAQPLAV